MRQGARLATSDFIAEMDSHIAKPCRLYGIENEMRFESWKQRELN